MDRHHASGPGIPSGPRVYREGHSVTYTEEHTELGKDIGMCLSLLELH